MVVKKLILKNFLNHCAEEVEFPEAGVLLLSGENGTGKSGLLEAIGFALYGYHATRAQTIEELRHHDASETEEMSVTLILAGLDKEYEIYRGVVNGKTTVHVRDADNTLYEGPSNTKSALREIMGGLDAKTFYSSFFAKQNELSTLTSMRGAERRQFIHRVLGIDVLDTATKSAGKQLRDKKTEVNVLQRLQPEKNLAAKELEIGAEENSFYANLALLLQGEDVLARARDRLKAMQEAVSGEEAAAKRMEVLQHQQEILAAKKPGSQAKLAELQELLPRVRTQQRTLDEYAADVEQLPALSAQLEGAQRYLQVATEKAEAEAAVTKLAEALAALPGEATRENLAAWEARKANAAREAEKLQANLSLLQDEQRCVTCLRPLDAAAAEKVFADLHSEAAAAANEAAAMEAKIAEFCSAAADREAQAGELALAEEKLRVLAEVLVNAQEYASTSETVEELRTAVAELQEKTELVQQARSFVTVHGTGDAVAAKAAQVEVELSSLEAELRTIEEEKNSIVFDAQEHAQVLGARDAAAAEERALEQELLTQTHELRSSTKTAARLREEIKALQEQTTQLGAGEEQSRRLSELEVLLKEFRQRLSLQIRPQIEEITSEILNALSSGKFPSVQVDENYEIRVEHEGNVVPIRMVSGGEEERANLCLRLAITRLVSARTGVPLRFIVLDEIFGAQDEQHRQLIVDSLEALRNYYPQIFLVSHVGDLPDSEFINAIISFNTDKDTHRAEVVART